MATIFQDAGTKVVGAQLSDLEYQIVSSAIALNGTQGLESLFQSFIEQQFRAQRADRTKKIIEFANKATDEQQAAVIALIPES